MFREAVSQAEQIAAWRDGASGACGEPPTQTDRIGQVDPIARDDALNERDDRAQAHGGPGKPAA